jgi:hypothetical protein
MINFPGKQDLEKLEKSDEPFCVSIYAPYIEPNAATNPNEIELKNLLREAETALLAAGVSPRDVKKTLRQAQALETGGREFWPHHHESLALFMHPKFFRCYHIPDHATPYMLTVEKGFNLEPLRAVQRNNKEYLVLVLDHKDTRLYAGDLYRLEPVRLKNFPGDMKKALNIDEYPSCRELHEIAPAYMGKGSEGYHSQYNVAEVDKQMLTEFFRLINRRLHRYLEAQQKPLILAGVNYLLPLYRQVNTYPNLWPRTLTGNFRRAQPDDIRRKAWNALAGGSTL